MARVRIDEDSPEHQTFLRQAWGMSGVELVFQPIADHEFACMHGECLGTATHIAALQSSVGDYAKDTGHDKFDLFTLRCTPCAQADESERDDTY